MDFIVWSQAHSRWRVDAGKGQRRSERMMTRAVAQEGHKELKAPAKHMLPWTHSHPVPVSRCHGEMGMPPAPMLEWSPLVQGEGAERRKGKNGWLALES